MAAANWASRAREGRGCTGLTDDAIDWAGFASAVRSAGSIELCRSLFKTTILEHGLDTFACGELDLSERDRHAFYVIDWPESWKRFYLERDLIKRDPLLDALQLYRRPFTWSELKQDQRLSAEAQDVLREAGKRGWHDGLVVPIPRAKSTRFGLVSIAGHCPEIGPALRTGLETISICFFEQVRTLVPRDGFAVAPAGLTPREIECIQKVALGRSDRQIADELRIAIATAHEHVEAAKRKLRVKNRAELAAVAVSLGIVPS